jgi:hypothetical protein
MAASSYFKQSVRNENAGRLETIQEESDAMRRHLQTGQGLVLLQLQQVLHVVHPANVVLLSVLDGVLHEPTEKILHLLLDKRKLVDFAEKWHHGYQDYVPIEPERLVPKNFTAHFSDNRLLALERFSVHGEDRVGDHVCRVFSCQL